MKDLVPLKHENSDGLIAAVLRSADADEAPPQAMKRVAVALGVQASLLTLSATASATAPMAGIAGATSLAGVGKALLIGVGAGALVAGGLVLKSQESRQTPVEAPAVSALPSARSVPVHEKPTDTGEPLAVSSAPAPAPEVVKLPRPPAVATAPLAFEPVPSGLSEAAPAPSAASQTSASIAEEVAELDRARALIATRHPVGALQVLDGYAARWPRGVLALEAAVLRVEAELARGNRAEAERQARVLIANHPNTGYARKVARWLGLEEKP